MKSFISDTLDDVLKTQKSFENTVFILPSQRAGVFVKQAFQKKLTSGFLPEIIYIEGFIQQISGIYKIDSIQLLFHFYTVYKKQETSPEEFDSFSLWAYTVIQDFNEIDQHLINSKEIFIYLKDIQRLKEWSVKKPIEETELMKTHFSFIKKLGEYYTKFYEYLSQKNIGYQGLMYREATKKIEEFCIKNSHKNFIFMGFNALNKAEEFIFQKMLTAGKTEVYWDIDAYFLDNNHLAGNFIRKYKSKWKYYEKHPLKTVTNCFSESKSIEVIGASKNITQIKYVGEILENFSDFSNTALVLADESLLPITLNSFPEKVKEINITMGYPLKNIPITALFSSIFQLFITQEKLQKKELKEFYYKDIIWFLNNSVVHQLLRSENNDLFSVISVKIAQNNDSFIRFNQLKSFLEPLESAVKETVLSIFNPFSETSEFIDRILNLISLLKGRVNPLDKEYLFRFFTVFTQLRNLQSEFNYLQNLKTLHRFFNQLLASESMFFQGEPLKGLQLMGMLETRVLDFENVIITSANEGVIPSSGSQFSFIPFDVKLEFGLPTYREKDAVFSYHFYRLMQRAKKIFLLYNTENDVYGGGEKSRFVTQLLAEKEAVSEIQISPKVKTEKAELKEIKKSDAVLIKLKNLAEKGISPSALTSYLYNPIDFYKQEILGIYEYKEVEETVAANTMGTIVHDTLDALYKPFEGSFITVKEVNKMEIKYKDLVKIYFKKHFNNNDFFTGKNRLIFEVSNNFVKRFLYQEKILLGGFNKLKIISTEQKLEATIKIKGLDFLIKIKGTVDRIDELNGVTRIIDYKTGLVKINELKISDFSKISEGYKYSKVIQIMLYAFLYAKNNLSTSPTEAGIISFKNLRSGFLQLNFSDKRDDKDNLITQKKITKFMNAIENLIKEIYNSEIAFKEPDKK